jgi:hypothetical protein
VTNVGATTAVFCDGCLKTHKWPPQHACQKASYASELAMRGSTNQILELQCRFSPCQAARPAWCAAEAPFTLVHAPMEGRSRGPHGHSASRVNLELGELHLTKRRQRHGHKPLLVKPTPHEEDELDKLEHCQHFRPYAWKVHSTHQPERGTFRVEGAQYASAGTWHS